MEEKGQAYYIYCHPHLFGLVVQLGVPDQFKLGIVFTSEETHYFHLGDMGDGHQLQE